MLLRRRKALSVACMWQKIPAFCTGVDATGANNDDNYVAIDVETIVVSVESRGNVTVNSTDPAKPPLIYLNGLAAGTQ